eukprot:3918341-Pleurochrysis_carterae.AAC.1
MIRRTAAPRRRSAERRRGTLPVQQNFENGNWHLQLALEAPDYCFVCMFAASAHKSVNLADKLLMSLAQGPFM